MVDFALWRKAVPGMAGMLCIGCLEERLGRKLTPQDFIDVPLNTEKEFTDKASSRLRNRLGLE